MQKLWKLRLSKEDEKVFRNLSVVLLVALVLILVIIGMPIKAKELQFKGLIGQSRSKVIDEIGMPEYSLTEAEFMSRMTHNSGDTNISQVQAVDFNLVDFYLGVEGGVIKRWRPVYYLYDEGEILVKVIKGAQVWGSPP